MIQAHIFAVQQLIELQSIGFDLHRTIQILVREGMPLEDALQLLTSTPAVLLGKEGIKGCVAEGADADLLVLDENLNINSLFARGKVAVWEQEVKMKGRFEQ